MKTALRFSAMFGFIVLTGCQAPRSESLDTAARRQAEPVRIEFVRGARIYENGDAIFAMVNDTRRVLWFPGQSPELPVYRLKIGSAIAPERNAPAAERIPLSPGETRYFEINTGTAIGPVSVGIAFYTSRTGTNGSAIWSAPATVPSKLPTR